MFENTVKICCLNSPVNKSDHFVSICQGGVFITPGRHSRWHEFTPVPSHSFIFVCMILVQIVTPARVTHSGCYTGTRISEIAATTIAEIELFLSQRSLSLRSLESDFLMIAMIAAIAELFFLSDCIDHSDRSEHMETRLKLRICTN